ANGCEANTQTDPNNCNACANACHDGPHSTPVCNNATCGLICDPGYADCDNDPATGCEVHTEADPFNCGVCGHLCSMSQATESCAGGMCSILSCSPGFADCNLKADDGCESHTSTDPQNCGMC